MNQTKNSTLFLDGIRGLAAFYVMVGHSRWLLWEGYSLGFQQHPEQYNFVEKLLMYFLSAFRYGHEAVLLFFVLSGFVIHLRYSKMLVLNNQSDFDLSDYFIRRIKRILPPLLLAISLTFVLDSIGLWLQLPIYTQSTLYATINANVTAEHGISTLFGNLLFVMKFYVTPFGTNGPLWSLAYEWWFYMLYPILFVVIRRSFGLATLLVIGLYIFINILPFREELSFQVLSFLPIWWMGVILSEIYTGRAKFKFAYLTPFTLLLIVPLATSIQFRLYSVNQIIWGLGFMGLFSLLFSIQERGFSLPLLNRLKPLGDISYSLYVVHMPILVLMSGLLMSQSMVLPQNMIYIFIGILLSIVLAILSYHLVEKPFVRNRK